MAQDEKSLALKYSQDYYVLQANELIRSKQDELSLLETKLIRLAIAQILEHDTEFKTYTCSVAELARYLDIDDSNIYKEIDELTTDIMRKVITIRSKEPDKKGRYPWKKFHWVSMAKYDSGELTIKLSSEMTPYLLGLNELFTKYSYSQIVALPTVYAIRLYELLVSYQNIVYSKKPVKNYTGVKLEDREIGFSIDYLREYFNCADKYPNTSDFVRRVVDPAVKAINEKTIMRVDYRKVKKGRTISDIVFKLNDFPRDPELEAKFARAQQIFDDLQRQQKELEGEYDG